MRWRRRHVLDRLAGLVGFAIIGAVLTVGCAPGTVNTLIVAATHGVRHDLLARHLRFYARVWSADSPWFVVSIVAELIVSVAAIMCAVGFVDQRARRAPGVATPSASGHSPKEHR